MNVASEAPREARETLLFAAAAALGAAGVFFVSATVSWPFTVDDSFIVLRYAQNLAHGHGPTLNPGLPPVEGVSQVLWMLWVTLPHWLGVDAERFAKWSGMSLTLLTLLPLVDLVRRQVRIAGGSSAGGWFGAASAVAVLLVLPATAVHSVAGLCTPSFTFLVVLLAARCARFVEVPAARAWPIAALALLLGLARPEGNVAAAVAILATVFATEQPARRRLLRATCLGYVVPGALYFAARWWYYGLPLPLPVYVKMNDPAAFAGEANGVAVALDLWRQLGWAVVLVMVPGVLAWRRPSAPALAVAAALFGGAVLPSPIMGYCWRYLYPALPLAAAAAGVGVASLLGRSGANGWRRGIALAALAGLLWVAHAAGMSEARAFATRYAPGLAAAHAPLAAQLAALRQPDRTQVLAIGDAGLVPYRSGWRTIDTFGLNEPAIARTGRHDPAPVLAAQPDVLVGISRSPWQFVPWLAWEGDLVRLAGDAGFLRAKVLRFTSDYFLWVHARPGPLADALRDWRPEAGVPQPFGFDGLTIDAADLARLQPIGLRYDAVEFVDALVVADLVALRTRGEWDAQRHVLEARAGTPDSGGFFAEWLPDPEPLSTAAGERVHRLQLPAVLPRGGSVEIDVVAPEPPWPPQVAADGRSSFTLRIAP